MIRDTGTEGYFSCASAVRDMSQTHILKNIKARALVLIGAEDPACTPERCEVLHREISGSQKVAIEGAAHLSNIEKPNEFSRTVLEFIAAD